MRRSNMSVSVFDNMGELDYKVTLLNRDKYVGRGRPKITDYECLTMSELSERNTRKLANKFNEAFWSE